MANNPYGKPYTPPPVSPETRLGDYLPPNGKARGRDEPPVAATAAALAINQTLDRLEAVIDQETAALDSHERVDFRDINQRKSQALLELTRMARQLSPADGTALAGRLNGLRSKLLDNQHMLEMHVKAIREIADLMVSVIGEAESDGTYGIVRPRQAGGR